MWRSQWLFQSSPVQVGRALDLEPIPGGPADQFQSSPVQVGRALGRAAGGILVECRFQSSPVQVGRALPKISIIHHVKTSFNPRPSR